MHMVDVQIADGIQGFHAEVPRLLMLSSAAVERNAIIGDDGGRSLCLGTHCSPAQSLPCLLDQSLTSCSPLP